MFLFFLLTSKDCLCIDSIKRLIYSLGSDLSFCVTNDNRTEISSYYSFANGALIITLFTRLKRKKQRLFESLTCSIGWGYRIHRLFLYRGVRHFNEYRRFDTKQSDGEVPVMLELWKMQITLSLPLLPSPLGLGVVAPDRVLSLDQIGLNSVLMLNWIAWDRTVLTFKVRTYAKLDCLKLNSFCLLNWIMWNRHVFFFYSETVNLC